MITKVVRMMSKPLVIHYIDSQRIILITLQGTFKRKAQVEVNVISSFTVRRLLFLVSELDLVHNDRKLIELKFYFFYHLQTQLLEYN